MTPVTKASAFLAHMLFVGRMEKGRTVVGAVLSPFFIVSQKYRPYKAGTSRILKWKRGGGLRPHTPPGPSHLFFYKRKGAVALDNAAVLF